MSTDLYLDYNGSTPVDPEVARIHGELLRTAFGNSGAGHPQGLAARAAIARGREAVARAIGARAEELVFTSGGTEANNHVFAGVARRFGGGHVVVGAMEHKSVLRPSERLEADGFARTVVRPGPDGAVTVDAVRAALREDTRLVSIMLANNETGVLQPVADVAAVCRERGVLFHCDAVAAIGKVPVDVGAIGCDLLSLSSHKLYAPKGSGVLFVRAGVELPAWQLGCGQQDGRRSGTENTAGVAAFGAACERMAAGAFHGRVPLGDLRDALWEGIRERFPDAARNGAGACLPNTLSVAFPGHRGCDLQAALGEHGISVAAGAAAAGAAPSHVLLAMGCDEDRARSTLRFSLGAETVPGTVEACLAALSHALRPDAAPTPAASRP